MIPPSNSLLRLSRSLVLVPNRTNTAMLVAQKGLHTVVKSLSSSESSQKNNKQGNKEKNARSFTTLNQDTSYQLCFLRHGQSTWNRDNRFIGWTDTPLTDDGVLEARVAGQMLARSGIRFDEVHTSLLRRSIRTVNLALMEMSQEYIPVHKHWRLNERNYGSLVGQNKKEVVQQFGQDQVKRWRRSYDEPPPAMHDEHPYHPARDPRYCDMVDQIPKSESLKCTLSRSVVYWNEVVVPALREGKTLLVVGHENNLRSLIMNLEGISPEDIINLSLPRAVPLAYRLDLDTMTPKDRLDGKLDEATSFLRGEWLGGDKAVTEILDRDHKQVYDTTVTKNLETDCQDRKKWTSYMDQVLGKPSPEAKAKSLGSAISPVHNHTREDEGRGFFRNNCTAIVPGVQSTSGRVSVPPPLPSASERPTAKAA
mmetsp:Transcript_9396/g.21174  ORF Transcript_9396/g.21174 Transcript_9396/m.21174 type:complete len:424 (-) Transcript_9396:156-1427(-)